ncbi:MAG: fumarylacetoacetate hydrolase family protein [Chloroflexaceae bacterium]|jgi:2-keto-4-pentenoate hydratase|nr:fumarylacetoacetate hydrolase family protein [Chloroflexaceae bacterium]
MEFNPDTLARQLDEAWETRQPLAPLGEGGLLADANQAYAVQQRWSAMRLARGERILGRKIGLTSKAIQTQLGVHEPDYGELWASRFYQAVAGRVEVPAAPFLLPRLEGELAFLIGTPLRGPGITPQQVLAASEALALAVEIVDSRIADWKIKLVDTVADNASYGGFTLGPWSKSLREADLRTLGMIIQRNGENAIEAVGAAALGHPARAVAWLANKLAEFDVSLQPGDIVLSGSLGGAVPFQPGDLFTIEMHSQPPLSVRIV